MAGRQVASLAKDASGWWAIVGEGELWRSVDAGPWKPFASVETLRANCMLSTEAGVFVGTSEARLLVLRDKTLERVRSFDDTEGQDTWYTPWGGPPDVRSMSADPAGPVYANVHVGGIVKSANGGKSWEPTIDIHSDVHKVLFDSDSGLVLAATARGLATSADGGGSWRFDFEGLHAKYLRSVAVSDGTVLVGASTGPRTDKAAVYRKRVDAAEPFQRCEDGLPESFSDNRDSPTALPPQARWRLLALPMASLTCPMTQGRPGVAWRKACRRSGVWRSRDGGQRAIRDRAAAVHFSRPPFSPDRTMLRL
jgi:hypothetical protein